MFFNASHSWGTENQVFLAHPNCPLVLLLRYMRTKLGIPDSGRETKVYVMWMLWKRQEKVICCIFCNYFFLLFSTRINTRMFTFYLGYLHLIGCNMCFVHFLDNILRNRRNIKYLLEGNGGEGRGGGSLDASIKYFTLFNLRGVCLHLLRSAIAASRDV